MKLAVVILSGLVIAFGNTAAAESQAEIAARVNQEGVDLMFKSRYDDAAAKFRDAVARVPEPKYFFNLCTALYQTGKFGEALTACDAVAKYQPPPELQTKTNKLIAKIHDEAKAQYVQLKAAPVDVALAVKANDEGKELMFASKYEAARLKFRDATAHDPQAIYFFNLCTADYQVGNLPEALDACKAVTTNHPTAAVQEKADKLIAKVREEAKKQKVHLD